MMYKRLLALLVCLALLPVSSLSLAEESPLSFRTVYDAVAYVQEHQPMELDLGRVRMYPEDLRKIKEAMPENAVLHFITTWLDLTISDTDRELNLAGAASRYSVSQLEDLVYLLPDLEKLDISKGYRLPTQTIAAFVDAHPELQIIWLIVLNSNHYLYSTDTAYSTFNSSNEPNKLTAEQLELLKYAPGLKALDLGHNYIQTLDFLRFFPDLEFLILACNYIEDIEMIGTLKHLKYLELFTNKVTDVSPLANCTELLDLNLSWNKTVQDVSSLSTLTSLERFWGTHMESLSAEAKEDFIRSHPGTDVRFNAQNPTSDGWREHPRYDHYIYCLHAHTWIPFDQPLP